MTCVTDSLDEGGELAAILAAVAEGADAVNEVARSLSVDLAATPVIAFELIKRYRLARKTGPAIELILALAERHPNDGAVMEQCFNLLHRSGAFREALGVLDRAVRNGVLRRYPPIVIVEADCLRALGMTAEAQAALDRVDKSRVRGVTAQILTRLDAALNAPDGNNNPTRNGRDQPVETNRSPQAPASVLQQIRELRAARNLAAAAELTRSLARDHAGDPAVVEQCFHLLHRTGAYQDALDLIERAQTRKVVKETPTITVIRADCLLRLGRSDEARVLARPLKERRVSGVTAQILARLHQSLDIKPPAPEILAIRAAFDQNQDLKAATLFRSLLQACRAKASLTVERTIRDSECEAYESAFAEESAHRPMDRSVLIISDSIALPRPAIDVPLEQSYPWLAHKALTHATNGDLGVWPDCRRGRTAPEALQALQAAPGRYAGIVLQVGIVDCAPRVFSEVDVHAVKKTMGSDAADDLIELSRQHRRVLEGSRKASVYVSKDDFAQAILDFTKLAKTKSEIVALATIVTPSRRGAKMSGTSLSENIEEYNAEIRRIAAQEAVLLVDVDHDIWSQSDAPDCFTQDNYHYNALGHQRCAQIIARIMLSASVAGDLGASK